MADTVGTNHADTLFANGLSKVYGRAGDDTVHGDGTGNYIDGGRGADVLLANGGASYVIGGASNDHIDLGNDPNARDAQGYGGSGNDVIIGSWNCKLFGNSGADFACGRGQR
jgi:Ca2+-binding RTX toxin-like protein